MNYNKLGERIREERIKRHLTQEKLAEAVDISTSYFGQIERGEKSLTLDTLVSIAGYFELSIDYLLRDSFQVNEQESRDEWSQLIYGKTCEEKQIILDTIRTIVKLIKTK